MALALQPVRAVAAAGAAGRLRLRAALFVPLSCLLWLCHTFGWGVLGVLAFSAEMIRQHDRARDARAGIGSKAWVRAGLGCLPLALPMVLMISWRSGDHVTGQTADWFNWRAKIIWMTMVLRDRWMAFDIASVDGPVPDPVQGRARSSGSNIRATSALSALFLLAVFVLLPRIVFGSAYADMRLAPFMLAIALIAIRPRPALSIARRGDVRGAGPRLLRRRGIGATTISYWLYDRDYDRELPRSTMCRSARGWSASSGERCHDDWADVAARACPRARARAAAGLYQRSMVDGRRAAADRALPPRRSGFAHDPSQIVTDRAMPARMVAPDRLRAGDASRATRSIMSG